MFSHYITAVANGVVIYDVCICCTAITCPPPPVVSDAVTVLPENYTYTSIVNYSCLFDFNINRQMRFSDGLSVKHVMCTANADWSETDLECNGEEL